jgi:hypothetical protein
MRKKMLEDWLQNNVVVPMNNSGILVQDDAYAVLALACQNQLKSGIVSSEKDLVELLDQLSPNVVSAYTFKYGHDEMTFGRAVRLLADVAERWKDLRRDGSAAGTHAG